MRLNLGLGVGKQNDFNKKKVITLFLHYSDNLKTLHLIENGTNSKNMYKTGRQNDIFYFFWIFIFVRKQLVRLFWTLSLWPMVGLLRCWSSWQTEDQPHHDLLWQSASPQSHPKIDFICKHFCNNINTHVYQ